ncbi:hypothetical protein ACFL4Y_03095 [Gemmatimonadota bacterium]
MSGATHISCRRIAGVFVPALALVLAACGQSQDSGSLSETLDPDGIRVIENNTPSEVSVDQLAVFTYRDLVVIGSSESQQMLISRSDLRAGVAFGPHQTIGYTEYDPPELRVFSETGAHLWSAGREGEGPGEFNTPIFLRHQDESGWQVYDGYMRRICTFDEQGNSAVTRSYAELPDSFGPLALYSAGPHSIWYLAQKPVGPGNPIRQHLVYWADWQSLDAREVYRYEVPSTVETRQNRRYLIERSESHAVDSSGRFWLNHVPGYQIEVFGLQEERWRVRRKFRQQPYPEAYRQSIESSPVNEIATATYRLLPDYQPAIRQMLRGPDSQVWVFTGTMSEGSTIQVDAYDETGALVHSFQMDRALIPLAIRDTQLLHQTEAPDGSPLLVLSEFWFEEVNH